MSNLNYVFERLRSQFSRGEPVLFTGAGFPLEAKNQSGAPIPGSADLKEQFWGLAFPSDPLPDNTRLGDAFYAASMSNRRHFLSLISRIMSVDSESLPKFYQKWFSMPWTRCYTLNVDDLELATMRRYSLGQNIRSISATSGRSEGSRKNADDLLEVIHLNGLVGDEINCLTFSAVDYASRQATPDQWLIKATTDIVTRPVVFVGTELDEPTIWQYMEYRKNKGPRGLNELRPGSILVTPTLNPARKLILRGLNIDWVQMDAEEFANRVLADLSSTIERGRAALRSKRISTRRNPYPPLVSDLVANPLSAGSSDYLLGHEPDWRDLISQRAIKRSCDQPILELATEILGGRHTGHPLVITGTAGSGKSTSLMRLALTISARGVSTYWIDADSNFDVHRLRDMITRNDDPIAILVDDADVYGRLASGWARELPSLRSKVLFACAARATKLDGIFDRDTLGGVKTIEHGMPLLEDQDIDELILTLDRENRLGVLKGQSDQSRRNAFRKKAGRQILVGMLEATSGLGFREKVVDEYDQLDSVSRVLYGIISLVHSQRYSLALDEVLMATGLANNETINELERLVRRGLVTRDDRHSGYRTRHRVVSEEVVNSSTFRSDASRIIQGLLFALASSVAGRESRRTRFWRRYTRFTNHEFLMLFLDVEDGRSGYETIEGFMNWDYHFWLQRGSLEVQEGDLDRASNYLGQALSMAPEDRLVQTAWSYLLMKKAAQRPHHTDAKEWFTEGFDMIVYLVRVRGVVDPHPYHILGSQTIAWVRANNLPAMEVRSLIRNARDVVQEGAEKNPRNDNLKSLSKFLQREWLMTAV